MAVHMQGIHVAVIYGYIQALRSQQIRYCFNVVDVHSARQEDGEDKPAADGALPLGLSDPPRFFDPCFVATGLETPTRIELVR